MTLALVAMLPFLAAGVLACLPDRYRRTSAWIAGVASLLAFVLVLQFGAQVLAGEIPGVRYSFLPELGLNIGFRLDGLAFAFALLILGIGTLVVLYGAYYLSAEDPPARFFSFLMLFMGAMLGIVLADNLLLLLVFWELTSLSSFLLIGYWSHRSDARDGARMALAITGAGGLCLLAGILLIGHVVGSFDLDVVLASGALIKASAYYPVILILVLLGCFTKSAQFPFHFWLPHAMAAPTPVSAYLHSATMVKAGIFLLARMYPALGETSLWYHIVTLTGLTTLLVGAIAAIFKHDLKGLLAYSTISQLGLITMLFGLDSRLAVVAGVFHTLNHAVFKASLFMAAGIIEHETGSRDMRHLHLVWRKMPITGALVIVACAAMAGVPLLNGFLSKEMFFAESLAVPAHSIFTWLLPLGATLAGICSVTYSVRFIHDVFFHRGTATDIQAHEPPRFMRVPVELLVVLCIAVGVVPALTIGPLLAVAGQAALGQPLPEYTLAIWHGFNMPLLMSAIALFGGVALYFGIWRVTDLHQYVGSAFGGREIFATLYHRLVRATGALTRVLANGSLQRYLCLLIVIALLALLAPFLRGGKLDLAPLAAGNTPSVAFTLVWLIGIVSAFATVAYYRQRLIALVLLGAVGLVVSLLFVYLSAPDLAMTQLLVESVTIVLMMLALHWLPRESPPERAPWRKTRDAALAILAGLIVTVIVYAVLTRPFPSMSQYFLDQSLLLGGGANVVNVILVDFRAYDTLGEITVLGIAGVIIYALLRGFGSGAQAGLPAQAATDSVRPSLLLMLVSRLLLPLAVLVSIYLFVRGHNAPGGGFIAGLAVALALILQFVANGQRYATARLPGDFRPWIASGLLIAGLTGVASFFFGAPFLTSTYDYPDVPLLGPIPLASAALFDLGVYLTVIGAPMLALMMLAQLRTARTAPSEAE